MRFFGGFMIKLVLPVSLALFSIIAILWAVVPSLAAGPFTQPATQSGLHTATFAAGCFWGVEATFKKTPGVISTDVGYTGGKTENPTYRQVCSHTTGHAEAVRVRFDPGKVSYQKLLEVFFENHDPTTINQQGPDIGDQYRSAVFCQDAEQTRLARAEIDKRNKSGEYVGPIVTEVVEAGTFYRAEEYHQDYFGKKGVNWSCHTGNGKKAPLPTTHPAIGQAACGIDDKSACGTEFWKAKTDADWRKVLTPEQYAVAREAGTERPFTGKYWNTHAAGVYNCAACGQALFNSDTKFDSGTGWPSFFAPVRKEAVTEHIDKSLGRTRTEVRCSQCDAHLGHVFDDGPKPTGLRYCMNSAVLNLLENKKADAK